MRTILSSILFTCIVTILGADDAAKRALLAELAEVQGLEAIVSDAKTTVEAQAASTGSQVIEQFNRQFPDLPTEVKEVMKQAMDRFVSLARDAWTSQEVIDLWMEEYGKSMSVEDLKLVIAYYRSPVGMKDVQAAHRASNALNAHITNRSAEIMNRGTQQYIADLQRIIQNMQRK